MDKNKDGFITKGELKLAKKNIGMKVSDYALINHNAYIMNIFRKPLGCLRSINYLFKLQEIDQVIKEFDLDKDGKLNMEEFRKSSQSGK